MDDFAALPAGTGPQPGYLETIRRYADRYGWLGKEVPVRKRLGSVVAQAGESQDLWAESLGAWIEEIGKVRELLHTIEDAVAVKTDVRASKSDSSQVRSLRARFEWKLDVAGQGSLIYKYGSGVKTWWADEAERSYGISPAFMPGDRLTDLARFFVRAVVEEELAAVHVLREYQGRPALRVTFPAELKGAPELTPVALHGALYLGVAQALFGERLPRRACMGCGRLFYPLRTNGRFCGNTCAKRSSRAKRLTTVADDNA